MVIIAGNPLDISTIIDEYPPESVENEVLNKMSQSTEKYTYDSLEQLKFELRLRKEIAIAARDLNNSKFSFATFHKSKCNEEYWERTENGGFKLKDGVSPAAAINDIFEHGRKYETECATAMMIVYYKALLAVFGEERFNELFPQIYLMNWHVTEPLLREVGRAIKTEDLLIGDRRYFKNPDVDPEKPEWQGENVIVLPEDKFYGHGIGIRAGEKIIHALNKYRKKDATESAYFMDSAGRPDFKKLADTYHLPVTEPVFSMRSVYAPAI